VILVPVYNNSANKNKVGKDLQENKETAISHLDVTSVAFSVLKCFRKA